MSCPQFSKSDLPLPSILESNHQGLHLESSLADLALHWFQVDAATPGVEVAQVFDRYPLLPGVVLLEQKQFLGIISRQRLLEFLLHPQGVELFLPQPLSVLHRYIRQPGLILPATTSIVMAAQMALRRAALERGEPIIVQSNPVQPADSIQPEPPQYYLLDIHELNIAYWQVRGLETQVRYERTQVQMIQTEKMASLGRLVDGIAHEILDPVGFIWGNLVHVSTYTSQIMELLDAYEQHTSDAAAIARLQDEIEIDYLRQDLPHTITSIRVGAERLKKLVTSLQNFCHIDDIYPKPANLHECLDSILLLLKSRLSGEIEVVRNYGHLPPVTCYAGQLNQVFMNILTNAIDALLNQVVRLNLAEEFGQSLPHLSAKPQITITTRVQAVPEGIDSPYSRWILVQIADNGPGLSKEKYQQLLASFSVEQRTAKETSLGLSYQIVTAKHGGRLYVHSPLQPDVANTATEWIQETGTAGGTEFEIWLPLV